MIDDARRRTLELTADLRDERLLGPMLDIVNPPLWEIGHVGFFHDHFVLHGLRGLPGYRWPNAQALYDSAAVPHDTRWALPLPTLEETLAYLATVRDEIVRRLPERAPNNAECYVHRLTVLHEDMHGEAFAYTRQTLGYPAPALSAPAALREAGGFGALAGDTHVPACEHLLGSDDSVPFRFDNEKAPHPVQVAAFSIARAPVTNAEFAAFVEDGGYERPALWSAEGWAWRCARALEEPIYWRRGPAGSWEVRAFDRWAPLAPHQPVCHVSWHEAEAYCRWAGRRLPSEAEWEVAASRVPDADGRRLLPGKRRYPWGDEPDAGAGTRPTSWPANLDGHRLGCVDVAAFPAGDSALDCRQMLGNVWEWTSSTFGPYPGFRAELYQEYSEPWFHEGRRVLRGGAWSTRARLIHNGYRNFFTPDRNDIFSGFRTCAL